MVTETLIVLKTLYTMALVPRRVNRWIYGRVGKFGEVSPEARRLGNRVAAATLVAWAILLSVFVIESRAAGEVRARWALVASFALVFLVLPGCTLDLALVEKPDPEEEDPIAVPPIHPDE